MSKIRSIRLPDDFDADIAKYLIDNKITLTDLIIKAVTNEMAGRNTDTNCNTAKRNTVPPVIQECNTNKAVIRPVIRSRNTDKSAKKPECHDKPVPEIVPVASPGDTIYEPDPVKPISPAKVSVSKAVAPVVNTLLSNIKRVPTVQHHPQCTCSMCKP